MIAPVGYLEMLALLDSCALVATDSGGLQKEAFFFSKHCLTLRTETEWVELVDLGANTLCGHDSQKILQAFRHQAEKKRPQNEARPYGDGHAATAIAKRLAGF
jgi:UDP-GlcNAc3NAcA epimerase